MIRTKPSTDAYRAGWARVFKQQRKDARDLAGHSESVGTVGSGIPIKIGVRISANIGGK
jgi:hypothetical protein